MSWLLDPPKYPRVETFQKLREQGAAQVRVYFSGGNDEGFVDRIEFYDGAGKKLRDLNPSFGHAYWDEESKSVKHQDQTPEMQLSEALQAPVFERYGSFAGERYVSGVFLWDVATEKITEDSQEEWDQDEDY